MTRKSKSTSDPYLDVELGVYAEMLRQARQTFNMHCFSVGICTLLTAAGGYVFLNSGQAIAGAMTGVGGTGAICSAKLARDSLKD